MVQFHFTNTDLDSLKGLYRIMGNGFVSWVAGQWLPVLGPGSCFGRWGCLCNAGLLTCTPD